MELSADKKSTWIYLDISPLFSHILPRLAQALVVTYDEIFQALAVDGDVLLSKPFLYLGFDGAVGWKSPTSEMFFFRLAKHLKVH
jgi:hypothetical protein